nr:hypothetical protein [Hydrococcus sp. Prado102]
MKKVVILESNPRKDLNLNIEIKNLENIIESSWKPDRPSQIQIVKAALAVRPEDLHEIMLKYEPQIVHFCGHGTGKQGLVFQDDNGSELLASTDTLSNLFELFKD